jgi:1-acyl-sn-glycerol-3-phosphate acyltransferase
MVYQVPRHTRLVRKVLAGLFRFLFRVLARVIITGKENVPNEGAYLIAFNHVSLYDPPFLIAFWPTLPEVVGAIEVWSKRGQSLLAKLYKGIPIRRQQYDRQSIETVISALQAGYPVLISPEGTRSHHPGLQTGQPGIAYLIEKCSVPVVPVGIVGTTEDLLERAFHFDHPRLEIRIGKPIQFEIGDYPVDERKILRSKRVELIMRRIADLLPENYRGIYANSGAEGI